MSTPGREGRGLVVVMAVLALAGVGVMAGGTLAFAGLGSSTGPADAEGPAMVQAVARIGADYAAATVPVRARLKVLRADPTLDGEELRLGMEIASGKLAAAEAAAVGRLEALRAAATGPLGGSAVLELMKTAAFRAVLVDGNITRYSTLKAENLGTGTVSRIEADGEGGGRIIFMTQVAGAPAGKVWYAYVWYDDVMLLNPHWEPLQSAALWNGVGLLLLLIGGFGWVFAARRRRRAPAEATYGAA